MTPSTSQPSPLVPGLFLDRYELLCPIAKGGMAEVWIARMRGKHGFQKLFAVKTILPEYAADPVFQTMFLDEAHISAGIEHVNVAHIIDLGEQHDVLYIVMEFVDGESLSRLQRAVLKRGFKIPPGIILRVLSDTCVGLHAAHELRDKEGHVLNVVHRDVSPQNILVSDKGVAKLIDFGVAKARDRVAGETNAGILKGKVMYMPPEQAMGGVVDRRADVFAIGAILYHLFAGRPPYDGENQLAMLRALTSGEPPPPLPTTIPVLVADVIMRALSFHKEARWATAMELHRAIEAAMVESRLATTTADVAAFVAEHLTERSADRRRAIDLALAAAAERERMQVLLQPPVDASGLLNVSPTKMQALSPAPLTAGFGADVSLEPPTLRSTPTSGSIGVLDALGATASGPSPQSGSRKRSVLGIVIGGVAVAVIGAAVGVSLGRRGASGPSATAAKDEARATAGSTQPMKVEPSASASEAPSAAASEEAPAPSASASASASAAPSASASASAAPSIASAPVIAPTVTARPTATAAGTGTAKPASTKIDDGF